MDLKPPSVLKEGLLNSTRTEGVMSLQSAVDLTPSFSHHASCTIGCPLGELAIKYLGVPLHYDNENQRGCATYKA